jgi:hypothetical protein
MHDGKTMCQMMKRYGEKYGENFEVIGYLQVPGQGYLDLVGERDLRGLVEVEGLDRLF